MKVITCFSYKGGAGRTTAAVNIAAAMASIEKFAGVVTPLHRKVALIDLDVFSAGMHRVFGVTNQDIKDHKIYCVQDYLREQMATGTYIERGGLTLNHACMTRFRQGPGRHCNRELMLFPARPDLPDGRFLPQKQHENVLIELLIELESGKNPFDYVILDGESGTRQMADIALRLADVVLMFFRLTWQHIDGTLKTAEDFMEKSEIKPFYLIPTCVPVVDMYQATAPGLLELQRQMKSVVDLSKFNEFSEKNRNRHLWPTSDGPGSERAANHLCIHDSLFLKAGERVIVFDSDAREDWAAQEFYQIAAEIDKRHPPLGHSDGLPE